MNLLQYTINVYNDWHILVNQTKKKFEKNQKMNKILQKPKFEWKKSIF